MSLNSEAQSPADQAAFEACAAAKLEYETCRDRIMPGTVFLMFLWLVCWLGSIVPLCMLCCCTQNPHQVRAHHRVETTAGVGNCAKQALTSQSLHVVVP